MPKARDVTFSTWPFTDGYPWDEELIRSGHRAVSTHGRSRHRQLKPLRLARGTAVPRAALERAAALA